MRGGDGIASAVRRLGHGLGSWLLIPFFLLGRWIDVGARRLDDPRRESDGLALILTGIAGVTFLEQQIALGLADAGFRGRIAIVDWTTGRPWRIAQHMRDTELHQTSAGGIAGRIRDFHADHPNASIHVVGYSGGAAVALQSLAELPAGDRAIVNRAALVASACSPRIDVLSLIDRTRQGIWHFRSRFDVIILGLMTRWIGTTDGVHGRGAGCDGFLSRKPDSEENPDHTEPLKPEDPLFSEIGFRWHWLAQFHHGGHFGYANRVWACETLGRTLGIGRDNDPSA